MTRLGFRVRLWWLLHFRRYTVVVHQREAVAQDEPHEEVVVRRFQRGSMVYDHLIIETWV